MIYIKKGVDNMPLTPAEKRKNRLKTHKVYNAYIPLFIANPFDEKLERNRDKIYRLAKRKYGKILEKKSIIFYRKY